MLAVICALGAALLYAMASVLQQRTASAVSPDKSLRIGLLARLLRNPIWVLGVGADIVGFVLQFIAIDRGTLVLVQPLLVCGLLFALPIGARLNGSRLARNDWISALAVCAGLGVFQAVASPAAGHDFIEPQKWLFLLTAGGGLSILLAGAGQRAQGRTKALLLSASAGTIYGVAAALTKTTGGLLSVGVGSTFDHWQPYALAVIGIGGMLVAQSAFQAGSLDVSLPTMSAIDPVVSILIGALAFGETIAGGAGSIAAEVVSLSAMVLGVYGLARSTAVRRTKEHGDPREARVDARPVAVRPARPSDAAALSELLAKAWRATYADLMSASTIDTVIDKYYSEDRLRRDVPASADGRSWSGYLVAVDNEGRLLGAAAGGLTRPAVAEVFVLYADPERLRHGTGTILLSALSQAQMGMGASEQWLSVTKGNELGLPFYRAQGFVVVEEVEPWDGAGVEDGVRSLRMCRALREPRLT